MRPFLNYIFLWIILTGQVVLCHSQELFFNRVEPPEGKFFEHVTGMAQDKLGYMWLATKKGLFRYDGYQMIHYKNNPLDPNSLANDQLEAICIDTSGMIWIGTINAGLERFDPLTGIFTHFRHDANDPSTIGSNLVTSLLVDRQGNLWIGGKGLQRYDQESKRFIRYQHNPSDPTSISSDEVISLYEDSQGELWIGTGSVYTPNAGINEGGLNRMNKKTATFTQYKHDPKDPQSLVNNKVRAIFEDSKGTFWVGTAGDGLHTMDRRTGKFQRHSYDPRHPEKLSRPPLKKEPFFDHITFIREDTTGNIWIGTSESGLNYYNTQTKRTFHYEMGKDSAGRFTERTTWWAYESREGVMWVSTLFGSLYRINPMRGKIPFYTFEGKGVNALYEDVDGYLWIGTEQQGIFQVDRSGKTLRNFKNDEKNEHTLSSNCIQYVSGDYEGNLVIATFGGGLNLLNRKTGFVTRYRHDPNNPRSLANDRTIFALQWDNEDIWVGSFRGISRLNRKTGHFRNYLFYPSDTVSSGFSVNIVTSIQKDSHGKWWAGSWLKGGLHQFDPETGKFKTYLKGASIMNILEDKDGILWAGGNEGLYRYNRSSDQFYRFEDPIFLTEANIIRSFIQDDEGNLWTSSTDGIFKINRKRDEITLYGRNYGINGNDLMFGASYKGQKGKLYFGHAVGYYSFFPAELTRGIRPPQIVISDFRLANKLIQPRDNGPLTEPLSEVKVIRLNHNQDIFSFDFAAIDFINPENNRHLFMLENYDEGWNLAGSERRAIYYNVPPGKYVFRVKAANSFGVWTERSIEVIITPPWWSTWWFRIGVVLAIAAIFYIIVKWRVNQKFHRQLERSEKEKQLAELRQKTGELEMQALRAQMNPHFIFNSLNSINRFILQNNKAQASEYLTKFSRLVRMILQNSQASFITLESELDALKLYLELEALRFDHRFAYKINVSKDLDIEVLKVPPLIIQPYAENAIWHGLMHKEEKGNLEIDILMEGDHITYVITDDGIGRKQSAAMASKTATRHKPMGLKITADRISMLERAHGLDRPIVIHDLVHPDGSAAGTQVIIKIPVIYD
jgi:ligand-binding sensor domain-containing protein